MKQHIEIYQLNELSKRGRDRLREWWKPEDGDKYIAWNGRWNKFIETKLIVYHESDGYYCYECSGSENEPSKSDFPLLSIGQMIEFLGDEYIHALWEYGTLNTVESDRVCDSLWEEVKKELERL